MRKIIFSSLSCRPDFLRGCDNNDASVRCRTNFLATIYAEYLLPKNGRRHFRFRKYTALNQL